jgi:hypothetical protein
MWCLKKSHQKQILNVNNKGLNNRLKKYLSLSSLKAIHKYSNLSINRELAQLVERHPYKVDVAGSNPVLPTNLTLGE